MDDRTNQLIEKLLRVERERKNRDGADLLKGYRPSAKQEAFHRDPRRFRWIFGGNRSGKSECGAAETVYTARGCHPYGRAVRDAQIWVVSLTAQVQRDVAQRKILKYLSPRWIADVVMSAGSKDRPDSGVIDFIAVRNVFGGISRIGFRTCEQGREKFQGASLDAVWFDEEPPRDVYRECRMQIRQSLLNWECTNRAEHKRGRVIRLVAKLRPSPIVSRLNFATS
jgi:hypothetical protein